MTTALDGLRVLDFSWGLPGAITTMVLADNGADVIKVEPPRRRSATFDASLCPMASWQGGHRSRSQK
jgi:crotonobetainyl-CoA:carnitine CoA-transferase CaiB-like acyl-CoA transferase